MNPEQYPGLDRATQLAELGRLTGFLEAEHIVLAAHMADHLRQFWAAYEKSDGASVSARQQDASRVALPEWLFVLECRGNINAASMKVEFLRLLLGSEQRMTLKDTFPPDRDAPS